MLIRSVTREERRGLFRRLLRSSHLFKWGLPFHTEIRISTCLSPWLWELTPTKEARSVLVPSQILSLAGRFYLCHEQRNPFWFSLNERRNDLRFAHLPWNNKIGSSQVGNLEAAMSREDCSFSSLHFSLSRRSDQYASSSFRSCSPQMPSRKKNNLFFFRSLWMILKVCGQLFRGHIVTSYSSFLLPSHVCVS